MQQSNANFLPGIKPEGLQDIRDPEFDSFLAANFDDFQGFPWGQAFSNAGPNRPDSYQSSSLPATLDQAPFNFSFENLTSPSPTAAPLATAPPLGVQQHRLLNDQGQAFSMPDLTSAAPESSQQFFGQLLVPVERSSRPATPQDDLPGIPEVNSGGQPIPCKERLSSAGSGELHSVKNISLAERNKQAQRRHRQRQRDRMGTLENQVKVLIEEKQALAAEKAALAGQAAVLTQVLQMRDDQLQQIQSNTAKPTGASTKEQDAEEGMVRPESAVSSGLADSLSSILTLTVREEQKIHLSPQQVKAMKPQEVARTWAEYLSAMMGQLTIAQSGSVEAASLAEKRILELIQEILVLLMRYALGDLHKMKTFVAIPTQSEDSSSGSVSNSEMWRAAARNLDLSDQQKMALCQLRRLFMQKQDTLIQQRQSAIASLHTTIPNAASSHDIASQFLKAEEAMGAIHKNLRMENQLIVDLIYTFLVRVASPIQAAKCLVQSFPWYPDTLCILTWIAAEAGDSKAMELLEQKPMSAAASEQGSAGDMSPSRSPA